MTRAIAIALNTHRETVRDKVLYNLVLFALLMIGSSYVLGQISIEQEVKIIQDLGLASIEIFGAVIAIFIGIGLVSKEIDKRTLYNILSKPVTRQQFLLGKYLGLLVTLGVNLVIMSAGLYLLLFLMTDGFEPQFLKAFYLIFLELALLTGLAIFFSTFLSTTIAGLGTGFLFVAGHFSKDLRDFDFVVESGVVPLLTRFLYYVLPNFENFDIKSQVVAGEVVPWSLVGFSTAYAALYVTALLVAGMWILSRRNLS